MSPWLAYPLSFALFLVAGLFSALFGKALVRRLSLDERELELRSLLPGEDCGGCGYPSCRDFAAALHRGAADPGRCPPGGRELEAALRRRLGREDAKKAVVRCGASRKDSPDLFSYSGEADCAVAASLYDGPRSCRDSCLGLGSCLRSCPLGAIRLEKGLALVDPQLCTGCGACLEACPTGVIALVPAEDPLYVACASKLGAAERSKICSKACNGCRLCERPDGAPSFVLKGELAARSFRKIADSGEFVRSCPTGAIREFRRAAAGSSLS